MPEMIALAISLSPSLSGPSEALEFTAYRLTSAQQGLHDTGIFYRDHMWRLEHNEAGRVGVTIVRQDRGQVWHLLPSTHHVKIVAFNGDHVLHTNTRLDRETSREAIGTQILDGHPTTVYEVGVTLQNGRIETLPIIAADIDFSLKLASKNGDWMVEYGHVKMGPVADSFFQLPRRYVAMDAQ